MKAIEQGLALKPVTYEEEFENATKIIRRSRQLTRAMMEQGFIPEAPEGGKPPEVDVETVKSAY
jgi:hypothetical protein